MGLHETPHHLYVVRAGKPELHSAHPTYWDAMRAHQPLVNKTPTVVAAAGTERRHITRAARDAQLRFDTAQERDGRGPMPMQPAQFGMHQATSPENYHEAHQLTGPDGVYSKDDREARGPWSMLSSTTTLHPSTPLHTEQQWVSGTYVYHRLAQLRGGQHPLRATDPYGGVKVYQHDDGSHWVIDGHHRIAVARSAGRPLRARVMDSGGVAEVRSWWQESLDDWDREHG